ncbi:MAG: transporter substrate-binding domain-containing protein [Intestinimonas sp.]|jgi:polar amino acid transport system substrate-binding protein|nr:transporter substrate-binding domain-containing protein [Intestinimonas sp.]
MNRTSLAALALALALGLSLTACGTGDGSTTPAPSASASASAPVESTAAGDDWSYIKDKGTLNIGITEYKPMNYYDDNGTLVGFDTDFAKAACDKLGLTPNFVVIDWDSKELELNSKNIDCIWNGLTVSEDRRANMDFTTSYLTNQQVVVIRAADAGTYTDLASLSGASVVAEEGSAGEATVQKDLADCTYTPVSGQTDALLEVKSSTADFAVVDYTTAKAMTGTGTSYADLQILEGISLTNEEYAIGFRKGSSAVEQFNTVISSLQSDGTLAGLAQTYGLTDLLIQ